MFVPFKRLKGPSKNHPYKSSLVLESRFKKYNFHRPKLRLTDRLASELRNKSDVGYRTAFPPDV